MVTARSLRPFLLGAVLIGALVAAAPLGAASAANPEIVDAAGDVDPASLAGLKPQQLEAVQSNLSMFDLTKGYVLAEQRDAFWLVLEVVDLDGGIADAPKPPDAPIPHIPTPQMVATFDVRFSIGDAAYLARATLEPVYLTDTTSSPPQASVWFLTNFTLRQDDSAATVIAQLFGGIDTVGNRIFMSVPKAAIGDPQPGTTLTRFHATAAAQDRVLDYAPDAALDPTQVDPTNPLGAPLSPGHGSDYTFGQYPGAPALFLKLETEGPTSGSSPVGTALEFAFKISNSATQPDTVTLAARAPSGWTVQFEESTVTVEPGSSTVQIVKVTPTQNARTTGILRVTASSGINSQSQEVSYTLQLLREGGGDAGGPGGSSASPGSSPDTEDSPALAPLVPAVVLAALVVALRRRR